MRYPSWRKSLHRLFGLARTAPIRWPLMPCLEVLEERCVPSFSGALGFNFSATEGTGLFTPLATFTSPDIGPFAAKINWGDGTTSAATVVSNATPLSPTGFNQDVVFEALTFTPKVSHDFDNSGFAWFQAGAIDTSGLPHNDGLRPSFTSRFGTPFQFQSFTGNNALLLGPGGGLPSSGTLTLAAPASYGTLAILASASASNVTPTVTVRYTDGTTDTFNYNAPDWISAGAASAALPSPVGRATVGAGNTFTGTDTVHGDTWQMFETDIHPNASKLVASLVFASAGPNSTGIFAVSGATGALTYTVSGSHTYADEGSFTGATTITDSSDNSTTSVPNIATVAEGDTLRATIQPTPRPTEGVSFSGRVANFVNTNAANNSTSDFKVTIDWGDGTITGGTLSNPLGTIYGVDGTHTYADEGSFNIIVTLSDDAPGTASATVTNTATVTEADTLAPAIAQPNATLTEGNATTSANIAVFSDTGYPSNSPSGFTATIDWGDGTPATTGTVSSAGDGNFTVGGAHSYADEGTFTAKVTLADNAPGTASATATSSVTVLEGDTLSVGGLPFFVTEGKPFGALVATVSDTNTSNTAGDFTATILWGDGTSSTGSVVRFFGSLVVTGSHTYFDEGIFTPTVFVSDDVPGTATGTGTGTATVAEGDSLSGTATGFTRTEGQTFSGQVATFTDPTYPSNPASDFAATIDWGDGTTTAGTVVGGGRGTFPVSGSHSYKDEGTFTATVTLTDDSPGSTSASATATVTVLEGDSATTTPMTITPAEGKTFSGAVASFTDQGNPSQVAGDWTATIDWGDGTSSTGTVTGPTGGPFTIGGSHTYKDEGTFAVTATFSDDPPGTLTGGPIVSSAVVSEGDLLVPVGSQPAVRPTEGASFSGAVAVFADPNYLNNSPADFAATIDWGDGTTDSGAAVTVTGGSGFFTVSGSHTYADEGTLTATATLTDVNDDGSGQATASSTASASVNVAEGDTLTGTQAAVSATEGVNSSGTVATFTDSSTANTASDFAATIDWGDGTTTAGTVSGGAGSFTVIGSHSYADEGSFTASVTLADNAPGTASATATSAVTVLEGDTLGGTGTPVLATEGATFTGQVATFSNASTGNVPGDFTATIDWGDGTTTAGTVSGGAGSFTVGGSHSYADEGTFTATVTLADNAPGTASATTTSTATVAERDALTGSAAPISTTEGTAVSGAVATFSDAFTGNTASDFTASIDWGDGTSSAGLVSGSGAAFTVSGSHTYTASGTFTVAVTLADDAPGTASATATATASVSGDVAVTGTNGDDTLTLARTAGGGVGSISYALNGGPPVSLTGVHSFTFYGLAGNDTMTVDFSNGGPLVPGPVSFDGGLGTDTLVVAAANKAVGTRPGEIHVDGSQVVAYTNVETTLFAATTAFAVDAFAGPDTADRATAFAGLTPHERFVQAVYLDELGRPGSKPELDGWAALFGGGRSQAQAQAAIASGIQHSREAQDHLVKSWYLAYLGRSAGNGEELGWVGQLSLGQTEEQVLSQILASREFFARAQGLIASGSADERYAQALYLLLMNRTGSPAEVVNTADAVPSMGRQGVALGFLQSGEFRTCQFEGQYNALLRRPDDSAGLWAWVFSTLNLEDVRIGFELSPEFFANG
jgi:hypothetical protein